MWLRETQAEFGHHKSRLHIVRRAVKMPLRRVRVRVSFNALVDTSTAKTWSVHHT